MGAAPQAARPEDRVAEFREVFNRVESEIGRVIVGHQAVVRKVLTALFCGGHVLIEGVPGLGKTLMVKAASEALGLSFKRIQFTPDLMPSDITGSDVLEEDRTTGRRVFRFVPGPLFANVILADEVNRTPPKTQAALLQSIKGPNGGYRLAKSPNEISLLEVLEAVDGPIRGQASYSRDETESGLNKRLDNICTQAAEQVRKQFQKVRISELVKD
jgi:hypothetical protein